MDSSPSDGHRRLSLEALLALGPGAALPSPTPSSRHDQSSSSDATISDAAAAADDLSPASSVSFHHHQPVHHQPAAAAPPPPPPPPQQRPLREYTCKECGKSFPTNQALGGHVAGHRNRQREAEAMAAAAAAAGIMGANHHDGGAFLAELRRARTVAAPHVCRKCHKEFATGVALGGHMRVHYTGKPIVPKRWKTNNKQRALALLPLVEHHGGIAAPSSSPGISLALSINTAEDAPSPLPAGADGSRVVRLFGIDISAQQVQASSPEQQCSGTTADVSTAQE
ncbi:hypothetical protein HU200_030417 [Digitaria exilis]|uniref:C2H2-type domain-containing protein n=1 Tax=Digitaria exilis TaxID=1010633 RepID=A0A835ER46_9POAL|nr:hypothetical protein HU200_030417 [Digitaria exilis]CAB3462974.1 unnamed protein product [Digitaria exilis]